MAKTQNRVTADQFEREYEVAAKMFTDCGAESGYEICDCDLFCPIRNECLKFCADIVVEGPVITKRNHEEEEIKRLKNEIKQAAPGEVAYWREQLDKFMEVPIKRAIASYFKKIEDKLAEFKQAKLESRK